MLMASLRWTTSVKIDTLTFSRKIDSPGDLDLIMEDELFGVLNEEGSYFRNAWANFRLQRQHSTHKALNLPTLQQTALDRCALEDGARVSRRSDILAGRDLKFEWKKRGRDIEGLHGWTRVKKRGPSCEMPYVARRHLATVPLVVWKKFVHLRLEVELTL